MDEFFFLFTFILFTKFIASSNSTGFFGIGSSSGGRVISYPLGKKVLNPRIRSRCPLNSSFTLNITPLVSILQKWKTPYNEKPSRFYRTREDKEEKTAANSKKKKKTKFHTSGPWNPSWQQETHRTSPYYPGISPLQPSDRPEHHWSSVFGFHPSGQIFIPAQSRPNKRK